MRKKKVTFDKHEKGLIAFACVLLLFVLIGRLSWGADLAYPVKLFDSNGELTEVIVITKTANGTGSATVDSISITSDLPYDTTLTVNDSSNWIIQYLWIWGADTLSSFEYLTLNPNATATVDTGQILALGQNHPEVFYGPSVSGTGSDTIVVYALDSGNASFIPGVKITIKNSSGATVITGYTNASGYKTFYLDTATYTIIGSAYQSYWNSRSYSVAGNDDSVAISGYTISPDIPADTDLVNVYGWLRTVQGSPIKGAVIQATRRANKWGVASNTIIPQIVGWALSDTLGLFQLYLQRTGSYSDTTKGFYDITGMHNNIELFKIEKLYIPDVDSLSIADSLSGRE